MNKQNQVGLEKIPQGIKLSKYYYWSLVERRFNVKEETAQIQWVTELKNNISPDQRRRIQNNTYDLTLLTKLRYFQYRVINKRLTTNLLRSRWYENVPPHCTFCRTTHETIIHLLYECRHVSIIWLKRNEIMHQEITLQHVIMCDYEGPHASLVNTMILIFK